MQKTFKYKAVINKTTELNANNWLRKCQILYNAALEERIILYKQHKLSISRYTQCNELVELKKQFPEFKQVGSQCLQDVIERLDRSFNNFYRRVKRGNSKSGFPRFRNINSYDSFTLKKAGWKLDGRNLFINNVGRFKLFLSRPIEGIIKTITIKRTKTNQWYVSFYCEGVNPVVLPNYIKEEIGIDVGISSFLTDSEGNKIDNPRFLDKSTKIIRKKQRSLSRKNKNSRRRAIAKTQLAKTYEKTTNQRKDFFNKLALYYLTIYHTVCIENLNIAGLAKNRHMSRSIYDVSWGTFFNILCVKAEGAGRKVIKVNPRNTSQLCSGCGNKVFKKLSERIHYCPYCGISLDRDINAAKNICLLGRAVPAGVKPNFSGLPENPILIIGMSTN